MLLLPYSTDAPIYHWPITTVSLIVVNTIVFIGMIVAVVQGVEPEQLEVFSLQYTTINPIQWITGAFLHGGPMHLLGNMFFLWCFGLIVEGKVGSWKFFLIYMGISIAESAFEQVFMFALVGESGSVGASAVIFGIMVIALLWAPENEVDCFYWIFMTFGTFEVRIITIAGAFLFLQIVEIFLTGFGVSSGLLHIFGAAFGLPVGLLMLRNQWVDCEDWDVISKNDWLQKYDLLCTPERRQYFKTKDRNYMDPVAAALAQPHSMQATPLATSASVTAPPVAATVKSNRFAGLMGKRAADPVVPAMPPASSHPEFNRLALLLRQAIGSGSTMIAEQNFAKLDQLGIAHGLAEKTLFAYVKLLAASKQYVQAIRPLNLIVQQGGELALDARLRIAQIQLKVQKQPETAAQTLQQIQFPGPNLTEQQRKMIQARDQLLAQCGVGTSRKS